MKNPFHWIKKLDQEPFPHNAVNGLKKAIVHVGVFGPIGIATHYAPFPWNIGIAAGVGIWRAVAEEQDYKGKRDTGAKAILDFASQVAGSVAGALIGR